MTKTNDPTAAVRRLFAAFSAGDLDALIETVAPESHWTYVGANPHLSRAKFTGRTKVRSFFQRILGRLEILSFDPEEWIAQGDTVVVFGHESGNVRATGESFRNEWTQKYVVRDNLIVEMTEYNIQTEPVPPKSEVPVPTPAFEASEQPRRYPDLIDDTLDDSFPASDPPSWAGQ